MLLTENEGLQVTSVFCRCPTRKVRHPVVSANMDRGRAFLLLSLYHIPKFSVNAV